MDSIYDDLTPLPKDMAGRGNTMILIELDFIEEYDWQDPPEEIYAVWQHFARNMQNLHLVGPGMSLWATQEDDPTAVQLLIIWTTKELSDNSSLLEFISEMPYDDSSPYHKVSLEKGACLFPFAPYLTQQPKTTVLSLGFTCCNPFVPYLKLPLQLSFTKLRFSPQAAKESLTAAHDNMSIMVDSLYGINSSARGLLRGLYTAVQDKQSAQFLRPYNEDQIVLMHWFIWENEEIERAWKDGTLREKGIISGVLPYWMYMSYIRGADLGSEQRSYKIEPVGPPAKITTGKNRRRCSIL